MSRFSCKQCAACCRWPGYVYLTGDDIPRLAAQLNVAEEMFIDLYTQLAPDRARLCLAGAPDQPCDFLDGTACRVYAARPAQCRDFPLKWSASGECPGRCPPS